jgi:hypothetical protein
MPLRSNKPTIIILLLLILAAVGLWIRNLRPPSDYDWTNHYAAVGSVIAEETVRELGPGASLVIQRYQGANPVLDHALEELRRAGVTLLATETVPVTGTTGVSIVELLRNYPHAAGILTYSGTPQFTDQDRADLPTPRPKLIIIGRDTDELRADCASGFVHLAIVSRHGRRATPPADPKNYRAVFDESYQIVRPTTDP